MLSGGQKTYVSELQRCLKRLDEQAEVFARVAQKIYESIEAGGVFHIFGSGHSVMVTEELFHRAGGLVPVNPIFEEYLMPHMGPKRVGPLERMAGVGQMIFNANDFRSGEVLILISNSGINPSTVELAESCNQKGLLTVGITSLTHSKAVPSRSGKKLYEVAAEVIDTGTPVGDACVGIEFSDLKVAPLSSAVSIVAAELLVVRICEVFAQNKKSPPVYQSANVPGGEARNKSLEDQYRPRIRRL